MATNSIFIYRKETGVTDNSTSFRPTSNNVVILANSVGVYDAGQILIDGRLASFAVKFSTDAKLTVGGSYYGEDLEADRYNISVQSAIPKDAPLKYSNGERYVKVVGAGYFSGNGTLVLASQSGNVKADVDEYDTEKKKSDADMKIAAKRSVATSSNEWDIATTANGPLPTEASVDTFLATGTLTVTGSLVGTISSGNSIDFAGGYSVGSDDKKTLIDDVSGVQSDSCVFRAATLKLNGNIEGNLSSTAAAKFATVAAPSATNNTVISSVFKADDFQLVTGLWAGETTSDISSLSIDATQGASDKMGTATISGNKLVAKVVDATTVTVNEIGSSSELSGGVLTAAVRNVALTANSSATETATTTLSSNVIEAVTIDGSTVTIGEINANAHLYAVTDDVKLKTSGSGKPYVENMSSNTVSAIALRGDTVTIGDMYGELNASITDVTKEVQKTETETSYFQATGAGIYSAGTLHVTGMMAGSINVTADALQSYDYVVGIGGKGKYTFDGRIYTNISVTGTKYSEAYCQVGIEAATLTADAFAGTINMAGGVNVGLQVTNQFSTAVSGDSFDVSGSITASEFGIASLGLLNLRVSGTIDAEGGTAIVSEHNMITNGSFRYSDTARDDVVELASTAHVKGDIDLYRGENTIILDSMAKLEGSMLASYGVMNVKFALNGVSDSAVVQNAGANDVTLNSGNTITVDLNYAKNDSKYILIQYADGVDAAKYWTGTGAEHLVSFLYRGETRYLKVNDSGETYIELGDVSAHLYFDADTNSVIVDRISGVEELTKFAAVTESKYDVDSRSVTISWDRAELYGLPQAYAYELEYTVYEEDGTKCGESVLVRMTDAKASSYTIRNVESDQRVEFRMRIVADENASLVTAWSDSTSVYGKDAAAPTLSFEGKKTSVYDTANGSKDLTGAAATFQWDAADATLAMQNYILEVYESNEKVQLSDAEKAAGITFEQKILEAISNASEAGETYTKDVTGTETVVSGMQNLAYIYWRIQGRDVDGNVTEWLPGLAGDSEAPVFVTIKGRDQATMTMQEDHAVVGQVTYDVNFQWNKAVDNGIGMKCYEIEYTAAADTDWEASTKIQVLATELEQLDDDFIYSYQLNDLAGGEYKYRISALDYANNQSVYIGNATFGSSDTMPPEGKFQTMSTPKITVEYTTPNGTTTTTTNDESEEGEEEEEEEEESTEEETIVIANATVVFSWSDTYTDDAGVYYKLQFSDSANFSSQKTYTYTTTEANVKSFTIDNSMPTMPVGIFATMDTVYWRVMAVDGNKNETGIYSEVQSFKFVDSDGAAIKHLSKPDAPYLLTITTPKGTSGEDEGVETGVVNVSWRNNHTDLGILSYTIKCSSKDGGDNFTWNVTSVTDNGGSGSVSQITGQLVNPNTGAALQDGTYSWSVSAVNAAGDKTTTQGTKFILDTVRPTTVTGLAAKVLTTDVVLSWEPSYDRFKIGSYDLKYRLQGSTEWNTLNTTETKYALYGMSEADYEFCVYAYDTNGNISLVSDTVEFTVTREGDLCDNYTPTKWQSYEDASAGTGSIVQGIGVSDKADYFYIVRDKDFSLTVDVSELEMIYGKNSAVSFTLCQYDGTGEEKALTTVKLQGAKNGAINGMLLDAGIYYFKVNAQRTDTVFEYDLSLFTDDFSRANMESDDTALDAGVIATRMENPAYLAIDKSVENEWVGYTDTIDYRRLVLNGSSVYDFTLTDINPDAQLRMTIYQAQSNGKLKQIKSVTIKDQTVGRISNLTLEDGPVYGYYVAVEAVNGSKGECSTYTLTMTDENLGRANNEDDNYQDLPEEYNLAIGGSTVNEWVGVGDLIDYRRIVLGNSGSYDFTLTGVKPETELVLTVWQDEGKAKLKQLKKITVKKALSGAISGLLLDDANSYYVSVEAKQGAKGQCSDYTLSMSGTEYTQGNNEDDSWKKLTDQYHVAINTTVADEWVGYGDLIDYRKIDLAWSGFYDFTLTGANADSGVTLTIWQDVGKDTLKQVKKVTVKKGSDTAEIAHLLLDAGNSYYLSVESKNGAKGKNSDYEVAMTGEEFTRGNNADDNWKTLPDGYELAFKGSVVNDWVGYGDLIDYRSLNLTYSGSYDFTLTGVDSAATVVLTVWQDVGKDKLKQVKKITVKGKESGAISGLQLSAEENYYVSVEARNGKKGEQSGYSLMMGGTQMIVPNNSDDTWAQAAALDRLAGTSAVTDWVGALDSQDWFKLELSEAGHFETKFDLGDYANVSLYKADGEELTLLTGTSFDLEAGTYALQVTLLGTAPDTGVRYDLECNRDKGLLQAKLA